MKPQVSRVFITGGASGLGQALALRYARAGWKVCFGDVHQARAQETLEHLRALGAEALFLTCDVTKEADLEASAAHLKRVWGGVDVVINNAGVAGGGRIERLSAEDWQWMVEINLLGVVRGCRIFTRLFKEQGHGHLVNVASMAGLLLPPETSSYNTTKAGVIALSETLRAELAPYQIGVTVVCPAFFQTNLLESWRSPEAGMDRLIQRLLGSSRLTAEDVAETVFQGVERGAFWITPHWHTWGFWQVKRLFPPAYLLFMKQMARSFAAHHQRKASAETSARSHA